MAKRQNNLPDYAWTDDGARGYLERALKSPVQYRSLLETLDVLEPYGDVLDAGAGPGVLTALVAERYPELTLTAVDVSPHMVRLGEGFIESRGLHDRVRYRTADICDPDALKDTGPFDMIYSAYSLHEWDRPAESIAALLSLLKDHGTLVLFDLRRVAWLSWLPLRTPSVLAMKASYSRVELEMMLQGIEPGIFSVHTDFPVTLTAVGRKRT